MTQSLNSTASSRTKNAAKSVKALLAFYPAIAASDPTVFTAGLVTLFSRYPEEVMRLAIDPVKGIPAWRTFMPSIAECKEFLDEALEMVNQQPRSRREEDQSYHASMDALSGPKRPRPTYDEMRAKHDINGWPWGVCEIELDIRKLGGTEAAKKYLDEYKRKHPGPGVVHGPRGLALDEVARKAFGQKSPQETPEQARADLAKQIGEEAFNAIPNAPRASEGVSR